jgi:hypothetical protein
VAEKSAKTETPQDFFFEGQAIHLAGLVFLLVALYAASGLPGFSDGVFLGLSTTCWALLAVANAVAHQIYVWLSWRAALYFQAANREFVQRLFPIHKVVFFILLALRPILAFVLGWANRGSLPISTWLGYAVSLLMFALVAYVGYSIIRWFGFSRATGMDHFYPEIFRGKPLVREGIFRFTSNSMYIFGLLILWIPGFLFQSVAALAVAAFSHIYVWVHYYGTEKPDMRRIYG